MSDELEVTILVAGLALEASIADQGQTMPFDVSVRTVERVLVFSEPARLLAGLLGRDDANFYRLGSTIPQQPVAHRLNVLAT